MDLPDPLKLVDKMDTVIQIPDDSNFEDQKMELQIAYGQDFED